MAAKEVKYRAARISKVHPVWSSSADKIGVKLKEKMSAFQIILAKLRIRSSLLGFCNWSKYFLVYNMTQLTWNLTKFHLEVSSKKQNLILA